MATGKKDQLSVLGVLSAVASNVARQRSLARARDKPAEQPMVNKLYLAAGIGVILLGTIARLRRNLPGRATASR